MGKDTEPGKAFDFLMSVRARRDSLMEDLAKITLAVASTRTFQRFNALLSAPSLLASALLREPRQDAMSGVLEKLNMPSRQDVLALSQRLTRLEMVLDDVGAGLDQLRRTAVQPPAREVLIRESKPAEPLLRDVRPGPSSSIKEA